MISAGELMRALDPWDFVQIEIGRELPDRSDRSGTWLLTADHQRLVAKLTDDRPAYVAPGLQIAAAVDASGIRTGRPVRTASGCWCVPMQVQGSTWSLAVLRFVTGGPVDLTMPSMPRRCGQLLGRVHSALRECPGLTPAGDLLSYYAAEAVRIGGSLGRNLADHVRTTKGLTDMSALATGVLYGDPPPEILHDPGTDELGLIDWGTPSSGPLLFDVLTWELFARQSAGDEAATALRLGYLEVLPDRAGELQLSHRLMELIRAIRATWA